MKKREEIITRAVRTTFEDSVDGGQIRLGNGVIKRKITEYKLEERLMDKKQSHVL